MSDKLTPKRVDELRKYALKRMALDYIALPQNVTLLCNDWHRLTAEIEELRLMWRCEGHGGHDPETHCYPCHTENLTKAEAQNAALVEALDKLLHRYIGLVESGDCGHWDANAEPEVMAARSLLEKR